MIYDDILKRLGEFGRYQRFQYFLLCLVSLVSAWHSMNMSFVGGTPDHHCNVQLPVNWTTGNLTKEEILNLTIPWETRNGALQRKRCVQYVFQENQTTGGVDRVGEENCRAGWEYNTDVYKSTIVSEWDLVCANTWQRSAASSIFFSGRLVGALLFGQLSDRFGRKPIFFIAVFLQVIIGTGAALSPVLPLFYVLYFLQGCMQVGTFLCSYVIGTELVGPSYRKAAGFGNTYFYAFGQMALAGLAYGLRDWRHLELAITLPMILFFSYWWIMPESARWLLSKGRKDECIAILRKTAAVNKVEISDAEFQSLEATSDGGAIKNYTFIDLVSNRAMAKISFLVWWTWLVNALVYYGLALNATRNLVGNPYLNFFLTALVEIPGITVCILLVDRIGRRKTMCGLMTIGGAACIVTSFIPERSTLPLTLVALLGKMCITGSYAIIYLMAAEVFPTAARNVGMGVSSMCARIGGILAPQIILLGSVFRSMPFIVFGVLSVLTGLLDLLLPETMGKPLPQTIEEMTMQKSPRKKSELQFPMGAVANVAVVGDGVTDNCHLSKFTPLEQSNEYLVESPPPSYTSATA